MAKLEFSSDKAIRWGMIGCGAVTELKSGPAYQKVEGMRLDAVMRRDLSLAEDYAQRHGVKTFTDDAESIIEDPEIDAVYIATPPDTHKHYALKVAAAGKPCVVEKPLAPTFEDSMMIVGSFQDANLPLFVAYYRRSLPRFLRLKELLDDGVIGSIRHIAWHLNRPVHAKDLSDEPNWRTDKTVAPGGYFDDLACHGLNLFSFLLGDFKTVQGIGLNQLGHYDAMDAVTSCWRHENGITGTGSWNFGGCVRQDEVVIYGNEGEIIFSVFDEVPLIIDTRKGAEEIFVENPEHIQFYHVQNIRRHLLGEGEHPSTGHSALHTSWVMQQIIG